MRYLKAFGLLALSLAGCNHVGVVYSEYQEFSLAAIRVTPENSSPVDINMGWNQGTVAIVARRGGGQQPNEAASIIAQTSLVSVPPVEGAGEDLLRTDSYFISGTAALAASAPEGYAVKVKLGDDDVLTTGPCQGSPEERIAAALGKREGEIRSVRAQVQQAQKDARAIVALLDASKLDAVRDAMRTAQLLDPQDDFDAGADADGKRQWLLRRIVGGESREELGQIQQLVKDLQALR